MRLWDKVMDRGKPDPVALDRARMVLEWSKQPYFETFLGWLREMADRPVEARAPHADLIASVARSNAFREIRAKMIDDAERARAALEN